jgi:hypothetical protein
MAECSDPLTHRTYGVSTVPCDWANGAGTFAVQSDIGTSMWSLRVGPTEQWGPESLTMKAGQDYYVSIKNDDSQNHPTCTTPTCNIVINWISPY